QQSGTRKRGRSSVAPSGRGSGRGVVSLFLPQRQRNLQSSQTPTSGDHVEACRREGHLGPLWAPEEVVHDVDRFPGRTHIGGLDSGYEQDGSERGQGEHPVHRSEEHTSELQSLTNLV